MFLALNSDAGSVGQSKGVDLVLAVLESWNPFSWLANLWPFHRLQKALLESQVVNAEMPPGAGHYFPSFPFQHMATEEMIIGKQVSLRMTPSWNLCKSQNMPSLIHSLCISVTSPPTRQEVTQLLFNHPSWHTLRMPAACTAPIVWILGSLSSFHL